MSLPSQIYRKLIWSGLMLLSVLAIGTVGYWLIAGRQHSLVDAFYMTFITIATIGFNEIIDLSGNPGGRLFTMFIAVAGIGVLAYVATNLTAYVVEGQLAQSFGRRRMEKMISSCRDHYIVCGLGMIGSYIVQELSGTKRPYVIVDVDRDVAEQALRSSPGQTVLEGDATSTEALVKAGIERARGVFAVTGDDNQNLVISLTAKQISPGVRVVARCTNVKNEEKLRRAGADAVVSPSFIGSLRMTSEMIRPTVVLFLDMMLREKDRDLRVEEIPLPERFVGKPLSALDLKKHPQTLVLAVKTKDGWIYNPPRDYVIRFADTLVYISTPAGKDDLEKFLETGAVQGSL